MSKKIQAIFRIKEQSSETSKSSFLDLKFDHNERFKLFFVSVRRKKLITHEYRTTKTTAHKATCDELPADLYLIINKSFRLGLHAYGYVYFPGLISTSMV